MTHRSPDHWSRGQRASGDYYLQVLGSGGPMHAEGRGCAAYAIWVSGRPAIVVDMGGDTPLALARAGAVPADVDVILISHLHADHVSGLADFLWGETTAERREGLIIAGPNGLEPDFPSTEDFLNRLIGEGGAFPAMRTLCADDPFAIRVTTLDASRSTPQHVLKHKDVAVTALSVRHGKAPALAYRVDTRRSSIVFAGDQSGLNPNFVDFASDAGVLVLHTMLTERAKDDRLATIVGLPGRFGSLARATRAKRVVLSHLMGQPGTSAQASLWSLADVESLLADFRREYDGPVMLASDLACVEL
ncbi:MAG TPA: MBL fold metallo-hydrolase [Gemmatimonadaceae bacterium]